MEEPEDKYKKNKDEKEKDDKKKIQKKISEEEEDGINAIKAPNIVVTTIIF